MNDLVEELISRCRGIEYSYIKSLRNDPRYFEQRDNMVELADQLQEIIEETER